MTALGARRGGYASQRPRRRGPLHDVDLVLWGVPLTLTFLAGILIASTQRQANYADWY
ncbi:MAG TPA: rod shape-determining protein RodA, partial [Cyanobium sp.]|nr:rod shape-determining protein RodA [Cyanobium sp.]